MINSMAASAICMSNWHKLHASTIWSSYECY